MGQQQGTNRVDKSDISVKSCESRIRDEGRCMRRNPSEGDKYRREVGEAVQ